MDYYSYSYARKKKSNGVFKVILFFLIIFVIGIVYVNTQHGKEVKPTKLIKPISVPSPTLATLAASTDTIDPTTSLQNAVQNALSGTNGIYGIVVKNLKSGESYTFNQDTQFETASLYKLWVMAVVYQQIQAGSLTENQMLSQDASTLYNEFDIDAATDDQTNTTITLSVADALHQMITISDNGAALLLTEKIGLSKVASFLQKNGFLASTVGKNGDAPTSTASDIDLFFEKLYKGKLANAQYTEEMINLLKSQALNTKIPQYLPDSVVIAHKTGELDAYTHDAGIIYSPDGDYILVVLTNSDDPLSADERISEVSKNVYNYFNQ